MLLFYLTESVTQTTLLKTGALQFLTILPKFSPAVDPVVDPFVDPVVVVNTVVVDTVVVSARMKSLILKTKTFWANQNYKWLC